MNPIQQGLYISVVGIIVLFIVCAIFYFLLVGLQAIFPDKSQKEEKEEQEIAPVKVTPSDDNSIVAAIAVALQLAQTQPYEGLGESLQENRSAWWSSRLITAHNRRKK